MANENVGKVVEVKGVVIDAVFPGALPEINNALRITVAGGDGSSALDLIAEVQQHLGDDRVRAVAMDSTDGLPRGVDVVDTGAPISVPVGKETLGRIWNVLGEPVDHGRGRLGRAVADPPRPAGVPRPLAEGGDLRDRDQGHRPDRALRARRQDRPLRRRRPRQDGADPGADPQRRRAARRRLGLRRRRRAHPRGQRPLARDDGVGRDRPRRARLRPDERAAGRAPARRALGPDDGGVLPRRGPGRPLLRRQHLPVRPGGLRGVGAPRPHAERRRLPADARDRDGPAPGADHLDAHRLGHVRAGDLRARRRPHRPGAGEHVRPPRRLHRPRAGDLREGHLPGDRPARLELPRAAAGRGRRPSTTRRRPVCRRCSSATRSSRTSSPSSAWTSSPTRTSSSSSAPARSSASSRSRCSSPRPSPVARARTSSSRTRSRASAEILDGKHDDLPEQAFYMVGTIEEAVQAGREEAAAA